MAEKTNVLLDEDFKSECGAAGGASMGFSKLKSASASIGESARESEDVTLRNNN